MKSVVTGLMMLAGAVVRDKGQGFDDFGWRREVQRAREAQVEAATPQGAAGVDDDTTVMVVAGPPIGTSGATDGALVSVSIEETDATVAPGDWGVACERTQGNRLVFDRGSVRDLGGATLFRWAPVEGAAPQADAVIYTGVADCREKSVEASWPGKRRETRSGTCGRYLVDAVCSARSAIKVPRPEQRNRVGRPKTDAPHASATP
ncbi:MAG TPA: hypothetical protein VIK30_03155 [Polyangia bacterium]